MQESGQKPIIILAKLFLILLLVCLALAVAMSAVIGMGYLLSSVFPLTLFQAAVIGMGTTFVIAFVILGIVLSMHLSSITRFFRESLDEFEEDDEYDEYDEEMEKTFRRRFDKRIHIVNPVKIGRNAPCPCGSGKKFKHCCGKN